MIDRRTIRRNLAAIGAGCVLLGAAVSLPALSVSAGPVAPHAAVIAAQNVDWLSAGSASSLNVGFTVLVPSWVPAPFGGEPSISASDGYYSLYWMNAGGDPTFLQVTGQVGGSLPAGSPYDLNNQLFVNASVNGYDAIHDVTPIYDQVWWIQDGILYNVNSKNMADTDSLGLANSLVALDPGSGGDTPTEVPQVDNSSAWISAQGTAQPGDSIAVTIGNATNVNVTVDGGSFAETNDTGVYGVSGGTYTWVAPSVDSATTFTVTISDATSGETLGSTAIVVSPQTATTPPTDTPSTEVPTTVPDTNAASTEASASSGDEEGSNSEPTPTPSRPVTSDGTDGPPRPVVGSDGTGGIQTVQVPTGSPYQP